jgi:uncharacterized protein with HEPN domain
MDRTDAMLDELETQVLLYRYSIKRENHNMADEQLRDMLRNKVNRKFQKINKKILCEIMNSHLNLLNSQHEREMSKIENNLKRLGELIEDFNSKLYDIEEIDVGDLVDIKVPKKQRLEMGTKILKEKLPALYQLLFETELISEVVNSKISELKEQLEEAQSDLEDLENNRDEIRDKLSELGL